MKRFSLISNKKGVLLPVILTVSLLLVALGMRPPTLPSPVKPKLHNRAVVEAQVKIAKADPGKICNDSLFAVVLAPRAEIAAPRITRTSFAPYACPITYRAAFAQLPSRAPPTAERA